MNVGMLWFDNDLKADLTTKVQRAVLYYQSKYGKSPDLCFVHPSMAPAEALPAENNGIEHKAVLNAGGVEIRTTRSVLPNHLWIGLNGTPAAGVTANGSSHSSGAKLLRPLVQA